MDALRQNAEGPLTFLCATIGSGVRLCADRNLDTRFNGDDCAASAPAAFAVAPEVPDLTCDRSHGTTLAWSDQAALPGPGIVYDIPSGDLSDLSNRGLAAAATCLAGGLGGATFTDTRLDPAVDRGWFSLVRGRNGCGAAIFGGDGSTDTLACVP